MYRQGDLKVFLLITALANIFIVVSLALIVGYHFYEPKVDYRDAAVITLIISILLRLHLVLYKVEIFEKRIVAIQSGTLPGGKLGAGTGNLALIFYLTLFWITVIFSLLAFMPVGWNPSILLGKTS